MSALGAGMSLLVGKKTPINPLRASLLLVFQRRQIRTQGVDLALPCSHAARAFGAGGAS